MVEANGWGIPRYATLLAVLVGHMAVLVALLMMTAAVNPPPPEVHSVELLRLPKMTVPQVRSSYAPPRRLSGGLSTSMAPPPILGSASPSLPSPPAAASDGHGAGVDWAAEARRALHAYEIRNHEPPGNRSVSGEPGDAWLRQLQHHAGEQMKTANGDWIVWVNADCYRLASSGPSTYARGAILPPIICPGRSGTPHEERAASTIYP